MILNQLPYAELGWFLLLCASGLALGLHLYRRIGFILGLFVAYVVIRTAVVYIQGCPKDACLEISQASSYVLLAVFMLFWLVQNFDVSLLFFILLPFNAVLTLICLWFEVPLGLIGNPSMNGTFMVATLFFYLDRLSRLWIGIIFVAIVLESLQGSGTSIPVGMLAVGGSAYALSKYRLRAAPWIAVMLAVIGLFGTIAVPEFFNSWDRLTRWPVIFSEWKKLDSEMFGSGGGTFWVYGPMIQHWAFGRHGQEIEIMRHMHSDWAQLYLEFGIVGFTLGAAAFVSVLKKLLTNPEAFAAASSLGAGAIFNWPMHCALTALFAVFLVNCEYRSRNEYPSRRLKYRHRKSGS